MTTQPKTVSTSSLMQEGRTFPPSPEVVQRALAAKNETQARRGTIFAAYLKLLPFFIFIIPGVIAASSLAGSML